MVASPHPLLSNTRHWWSRAYPTWIYPELPRRIRRATRRITSRCLGLSGWLQNTSIGNPSAFAWSLKGPDWRANSPSGETPQCSKKDLTFFSPVNRRPTSLCLAYFFALAKRVLPIPCPRIAGMTQRPVTPISLPLITWARRTYNICYFTSRYVQIRG